MQNMPASLASRNSAMGGVPSSGVQQPVGISSGRFASNNLPMALSQVYLLDSVYLELAEQFFQRCYHCF